MIAFELGYRANRLDYSPTELGLNWRIRAGSTSCGSGRRSRVISHSGRCSSVRSSRGLPNRMAAVWLPTNLWGWWVLGQEENR